MLETKLIDGNLFKQMIINGTLNLKKNYQRINNLNVFPVPDGDTGTNMQMTMMEGIRKIQLMDNPSIIKVTKVLSDALLIGSKGNSGVILSQFFSGIYEYINNLKKNNINVEEFIDSMVNGYQKSYKAVMEPVEGTILTVLRESIENTKTNKKKIKTIKEMFQIIIKNAKISLSQTPNLLPILKKSNVVDSGGTGLVSIFEGMLLYLDNIKLEDKEEDMQIFNTKEQQHIHTIKDLKYCYCFEFIIQLNNSYDFDVDLYKNKMKNHGDSLILLKDNDLLKIHIHTNNVDDILKDLLVYGKLVKSKIDNMKKQNKSFILNNYKQNNKILNKYFIIAFASGREVKNIFKDLKADLVIDSKQKSFSIKNLVKILEKNNSENIIILPNETKIIPALKKQFQTKSEFNIKIINTESIAEIYSALLVFDTNVSLKENLNNINKNIQKVKIGKIINSKYFNKNKNNLSSGCFLAVFKRKIIENNKDLILLTQNLLKVMIQNVNNFLTIFYNKQNIFQKNLEKIEIFLEKKYPNLEIEKIQNNNKTYPYIFVLE